MSLKRIALAQTTRVVVTLLAAAGLTALVWWRGPDWHQVGHAFDRVQWEYVFAAIGLNLFSVALRAFAWRTVINQAMEPPHPSYPLVFSAFSVGLFANAVLPGRIGELARVAVLTRKLRIQGRGNGTWAVLVGTVFAHRLFDLVPTLGLIIYVLATAKIPHWAISSLVIVSIIGFGLLAFDIHAPLPAAGLVLLLMNVATLFPLWPGNIGLLQAAIALPLRSYGVAAGTAIAFGFGLQAIEASVGVGVGMIFLAREGLSFAMLRRMPDASEAEVPDEEEEPPSQDGSETRARAGVPG